MSLLDNVMKHFQKRISKSLLLRPNRNLTRLIRDLTKSYNNSIASSHGLTPAQGDYLVFFNGFLTLFLFLAKDPILDPYLRKIMFKHHDQKLTPFDTWLQSQLKLQKLVHTPRKKPLSAENFNDYHDYRIGDKARQF